MERRGKNTDFFPHESEMEEMGWWENHSVYNEHLHNSSFETTKLYLL